MAIKQSEAIFYLAQCMGEIDGEWTEREQLVAAGTLPVFRDHLENIDWDAYRLKLKRGEITKESSIATLKTKTIETQLDALAIVWGVLVSDGDYDSDNLEKPLLLELAAEFDIDYEIARDRWRAQKLEGVGYTPSQTKQIIEEFNASPEDQPIPVDEIMAKVKQPEGWMKQQIEGMRLGKELIAEAEIPKSKPKRTKEDIVAMQQGITKNKMSDERREEIEDMQ